MDNIKDIIPEVLFFQKDFEELMNNLIKDSKTEEMRSYYKNRLNGGKCFYCKKDWIKIKTKTPITNYLHYNPNCDCYKKIERKKQIKENEIITCESSGIPKEYMGFTLNMMNTETIKEETKTAIEKAKNYIKRKKYESKIGCIFYGDIGTGKTHMAVSIFKHLITKKKYKGRFVYMSDIITDIIKSKYDFIKVLLSYDVILLDDLDKLNIGEVSKKNAWISERMFSLFNGLISNEKIIIGTTNCKSIEDFKKVFDSAVVSRLVGSCIFIKVTGNDYRLEKAVQNDK